MRVVVKIGVCEVSIDDGNSAEPSTVRWKDQAERIQGIVESSAEKVMLMHSQMVGDNAEGEKA